MLSKRRNPGSNVHKEHQNVSCEDHMLYNIEIILAAMMTAQTVKQAVVVVAKKTMLRLILKEATLSEVALVD